MDRHGLVAEWNAERERQRSRRTTTHFTYLVPFKSAVEEQGGCNVLHFDDKSSTTTKTTPRTMVRTFVRTIHTYIYTYRTYERRPFVPTIHTYIPMYRIYERTTYELIETDDVRAK
jgi:hypothetical protein